MTTTFADLTATELDLVTAYRRYTAPMWETNAFDDVEADLWELHRELGVGVDEFAEPCASTAAGLFWNGEYRRLESARRAAAAGAR